MSSDTHGLFWNSNNGDRVYDADSFSEWLNHFFTSGVFANELVTTATTGMGISVSPGYVNVNGKVRFFDSATTFTLASANSTYPRIDTVVIERNETNREITMKVVTGQVSGSTPAPTAPTRSLTVYQLVIAQILVPAGATAITAANITDKRMDKSVCGYVAGTVEELDWDQITAQWEAYLTGFKIEHLDEFETWFQKMKDQLSEDAAGHLQDEIDGIADDITDLSSAVSNIETSLSGLLSVQSLSQDNISMAAGGQSGGGRAAATVKISAARTGWTPLAVVGFKCENASSSGAGSSFAFPYFMRLNGDGEAEIHVRNMSTSAANIKVTMDVLYIKETST